MKRGQVNIPIIILSALLIILLFTLIIFIWQILPDEDQDDPTDLENLSRLDQLDDAVQHNLSLTENAPSCNDECSARGLRKCSGNGYKICGNFDSDECYEWSSKRSCDSGEECSSGICREIEEGTVPDENQEIPEPETTGEIRYDFDEIELLSAQQFNISKSENNSQTWADSLLGDSNQLEITHSVFNLKKQGQVLVENEEFLKVKGINGERRFLLNSGGGFTDLDDGLRSTQKQFWSAKKLIGEDVVKDKTPPVYSVTLELILNKQDNIVSAKLAYSDKGLDLENRDKYFDWKIVEEGGIEEPGEEDINCSLYQEIDFYLNPLLTVPNSNLFASVKNKAETSLPQTHLEIYDSNDNFIKNINLYNDGQHEDAEANDYISSNYFNISEKGNYYAKICDKKIDFEIKELHMEPLFEGHNDINADRINIILIGSGYNSMEDFLELSRKILAFDGEPEIYSINNSYTKIDEEGQERYFNTTAKYFQLGYFATEPLKANKDKFNIWYLSEQIDGSLNELFAKIRSHDPSQNYFSFLDLDYTYPSLIINGDFDEGDVGLGSSDRSHANVPSFYDDEEISKEAIKFGLSFNSFRLIKSGIYDDEEFVLEGVNTVQSYSLFTHESGHALFGLKDEYFELEKEIGFGFPQCAKNQTEAEQWWGDLIGEVDPFYDEYMTLINGEEYTNINNDFIEIPTREEITVGYFNGGCGPINYGDSGVVRPTQHSMMKDHRLLPVFGSVNQRRVEQVLNLFSGE